MWKVKEKYLLGAPPIEAAIGETENRNIDQVVVIVDQDIRLLAESVEVELKDDRVSVVGSKDNLPGENETVSDLNSDKGKSDDLTDDMHRVGEQLNDVTLLTEQVVIADEDSGESSTKKGKNGKNQQEKGWKEAKGKKQEKSSPHYVLRQRTQVGKVFLQLLLRINLAHLMEVLTTSLNLQHE